MKKTILKSKKLFAKELKTLQENGFNKCSDWKFGLVSSWSTDHEHYFLKLMEHDVGCYLIITCHAGGENKSINIGSSNNANDIINIRNSLEKLW